MGGSYSKINRKLPKSLPKIVQPGVTPNSSTVNPPNLREDSTAKEYSGQHDNDKDPLLLANLRQLGQINVEAPVPEEQILNMYEIRRVSEQQAASSRPVPNCLSASLLASLLDSRKLMNSQIEVKNLAARYNFDYPLLEKLALFVTTPSVGEGTITRTKNVQTGEERMTMTAAWSQPFLK